MKSLCKHTNFGRLLLVLQTIIFRSRVTQFLQTIKHQTLSNKIIVSQYIMISITSLVEMYNNLGGQKRMSAHVVYRESVELCDFNPIRSGGGGGGRGNKISCRRDFFFHSISVRSKVIAIIVETFAKVEHTICDLNSLSHDIQIK